ncbi:MAG: FAD-dependent oxidoreductase [Asgard group archaeon]|nr:FAD-dependent oxidoreductase [Asgard group archaeon]
MTSEADPRIGVFVCKCGKNIAAKVAVNEVAEYAKTLDNVEFSQVNTFTCSAVGQNAIKDAVKEHNLDRVVVASCSPTMHESTFQAATEEAGINRYQFQMANIREFSSWVTKDPAEATSKAKRIVTGAVRRVAFHEPLEEVIVPVNPNTLVIGGGIAGISAALKIADAGHKVILVEKEPSIGGRMAQLDKTFPTLDCAACILSPRMVDVGKHPNIEMMAYSEVVAVDGYIGNFNAKIKNKAKSVDEEKCTSCGDCWENCPVRYTAYTEPAKIVPALLYDEKTFLDKIITKYKDRRGAIMPVLEAINSEYRYLPEESLKYVAVQMDYPLSSIYRIATFYNAYSLEPRGDHLISVCMGTTCHVKGAPRLVERLKSELKIDIGETTDDGKFTLETVRCLGCCSLAPVITIDGEAFGNMKPSRIPRVLDKYE